jgi:hypothetical protein
MADMVVARAKLILRPYTSLTMPHTGAPTHMPANTTLFSPDSSTAVRPHSHLACRQRRGMCATCEHLDHQKGGTAASMH